MGVVVGKKLLASEVSAAVSRILDSAVASSEQLTGYGNENWKVTTTEGERYVAKFGPLSTKRSGGRLRPRTP